ncbi:MAG: hypothetical protein ABSG67_10990 [Thermoguttaceae bacterium]
MKTATRQILTFSIWIGMLAGTQLLAQQTNPIKQSAHIAPSKTIYVAQQQESTDQSSANSTSTGPSQNSAPAAASQTQPSDSVPGTVFPGVVPSDQNLQAMPDNMQGAENGMAGVENGLWDGAEPGNCCAVCGGGYCTPPCWYLEQGARIITRSKPRNVGLGVIFVQGTNPTTGAAQIVPDDVLTTKNINYDAAVGYDATIGRYLGRDSMDRDDFLEFSYWGMNTWVDSDLVQGQRVTDNTHFPGQSITFGNLQSPFLNNAYLITGTNTVNGFGAGGFNQADLQTLTVNSEIHNWELNLCLRPRGRPDQLVVHPSGLCRRECQPGTYMSFLVGIRYMTLGDGALWHGQGTINDNGAINFITGDYNVRTENDLLGLQIGTDMMFRRCKWAWGMRAKVGPYVNFARDVQEIKNNAVADPFNSVFFDTRLVAQKQLISLIGQVGFEATYKFKPNLMGRAAYDFMWVNGLALGPEQFQFTDTPVSAINTNGSLFSHGLTLDLEWSW